MAKLQMLIAVILLVLALINQNVSSVDLNRVMAYNTKRTNNYLSTNQDVRDETGARNGLIDSESSVKREKALDTRNAELKEIEQAKYASKILKMIMEMVDLYRSSEPK